MENPNADFWNRQSSAYTAEDGRRRSYHAEFATILNEALVGDVLCVGGIFQNADLDRKPPFSVVDVSDQMLSVYASRGATVHLGDARRLPISDASVDHVVFPLMLHHITDGQAAASRQNVETCFREAMRVLRPGGVLWAIEILVSDPVYWTELAMAPATRSALAIKGIPLVIFHSPRFYLSRLRAAGFRDGFLTRSQADQGPWYRLIRPVIGLSLRVPQFLVPVTYGLLRGVKPV